MKFIADFHVHSRFSRATAKNMDLENLYIAAQLKGLSVIGTGDFTHPEWFSLLREKLVADKHGIYRLKSEIAKECDVLVPSSCRSSVGFMLVTEISNIYKKNGKTRKNHNLAFVPDFDSAERFNARLSAIGNVKSDGRPILGLDARDLLEILLETTDRGFFVPAHIWTPWFSLLGSKSGFDSVEECFEDLTPHIHAVETGLSSDPPMNRRVSGLDGLTLISNSDAHSPANLARECNLFDVEPTYDAIVDAMKSGDPDRFLGTLEFFPEEGKYHYDGHRKCGVRFDPEQSLSHKGICPVCGKPLTLGVMYRINELADRTDKQASEKRAAYHSLLPMADILSEALRVGPRSKKVMGHYRSILEKLGPELKVLRELSLERIAEAKVPLLDEAIRRMRENRLYINPGYDGEFGRVKIFEDGERERLTAQKRLFAMPVEKNVCKWVETEKKEVSEKQKTAGKKSEKPARKDSSEPVPEGVLNEEQEKAVRSAAGALLIVAGPGTGKTRTLTHRIAHLISNEKVSPKNILAVTFTNKAAEEMKDRLRILLGNARLLPAVGTFHSLCLGILKDEFPERKYSVLDEEDRIYFVRRAVDEVKRQVAEIGAKPARWLKRIVEAKQEILGPGDDLGKIAKDVDESVFRKIYACYQDLLLKNGCRDFEDLVYEVVVLLESDPAAADRYRDRFRFVFVDEYQDLNHSQYRFVRAVAPSCPDRRETGRGLCVIGDPDQSIYGFRGADVSFFRNFMDDYPGAAVIGLKKNYRSSETILSASHQVIRDHRIGVETPRIFSGIAGASCLTVIENETDRGEAEAVSRIIEKLVGGAGFFSIDSGAVHGGGAETDRSFSDFAVLYRTREQGEIFDDVFEKRGIPCQLVGKENMFGKKGVAELLSFLKIIHGVGVFPDLQKALSGLSPGIEISETKKILVWGEKNGFSIQQLLQRAKTDPISGVRDETARMMREFTDRLAKIRSEIENVSEKLTVKMQINHLAKQTPLKDLIFKSGSRVEGLNKILDFSKQFGKNMDNFLSSVALQTDQDAYSHRAEKVSLMTMHAAKGLEFPIVFIAGCENGFIPYNRENENMDPGEERRLFYVALTRAKEGLYLTWSRKRRVYGKTLDRKISPFVNEIEKNLIKTEKKMRKKEAGGTQVQLSMF